MVQRASTAKETSSAELDTFEAELVRMGQAASIDGLFSAIDAVMTNRVRIMPASRREIGRLFGILGPRPGHHLRHHVRRHGRKRPVL